jgi:ankyrin repeat protein
MQGRFHTYRTLAFALAWLLAAPFAGAADGSVAKGQALLRALREDDVPLAATLIGEHADVNGRDETGATPLIWAAQRRSLDLTARLLKAHADPNVLSVNGLGALQVAIANHAGEIALLLIDAGAKVNVARAGGETPLMSAARTGQIEVMQRLIARGADVNAHESKFNQTALMWSAGHPAQVKLLIEHRADIRARSKIWDVTNAIYTPIVATVGVTGIPWNHDGEFASKTGGQSALFFAVQNDDIDSTRALLDAGVDVNDRSADGATALLIALYKWNWPSDDSAHLHAPRFDPDIAMANLLLDRGAKVNVTDAEGYTPLHGAVLGLVPHPRLVDNVRVTDGAVAAAKPPVDPESCMALVKRLLDSDADPNAVTRYPTPGSISAVRINPVPPGSTPMHIAALSGNVRLVEMLVARGGDPNLMRQDGHSPLSVSVKINDLPVTSVLVAHGGDVKQTYSPADLLGDPVNPVARARADESIMHIAAAAGAYDVIAFLAQNGAPLELVNDKGETPLDLADAQERFRYARVTQDAASLQAELADDPAKHHVIRETRTSDLLKKLLSTKATSSARPSRVSGF